MFDREGIVLIIDLYNKIIINNININKEMYLMNDLVIVIKVFN